MKVAFIVPGGVGRDGERGVIPCLLWLIERIARKHETRVIALRQEARPSRYSLLGAEVHNIGAAPQRLRAAAALLRGRFDVLHAAWTGPGVAGALGGAPLLLHLTGGDLAALPEIGYGGVRTLRGRLALRFAASRAARITTPSLAMQLAARRLGIDAERLPFGVALDRWPPLAPRRRDPGQPARLLHAATLNPVKDQPTLLRAAKLLRDAGQRFHLDIAGEDTLGGRIQRLAGELGLSNLVTFHGWLPHARLRSFMERADLLLMTSLHEADPIVLLEAAVAGVPAVSTWVGHAADWSPDAAVTVPVGEHEAFARQTAALLAGEDRRLRLAQAAQDRALEEDADWTARRVLAIYEAMSRSPRRNSHPERNSGM